MFIALIAWDNETIDHWHNEEFKQGDMVQPLTEESSFATLFPKYREKFLQKVWPHVTRVLKGHVRKRVMYAEHSSAEEVGHASKHC